MITKDCFFSIYSSYKYLPHASAAVLPFSLKHSSLEYLSSRKGKLFLQRITLHPSVPSAHFVMESIEEEFVHSQYGQGYFADVDAIREQEYPLLNGIA